MTHRIRFALATALLLALALPTALAQDVGDPASFQPLLTTIDESSNLATDFTASMSLDIRDPEEGDDARDVLMFRRDSGELFLLLIERPETQLGQGYLQLEDGLWFYDPESREFTYTSLAEAFEGSDARNDDFGTLSMAEDYRVVAVEEGTLGSFEVWILDLEATHNDVTYPFQRIWVTRGDDTLLLKSEDYSLTRRLLRTSYYPSYVRVGDNLIADRMLFVDALVEGKSTEVVISDISTTPIPDNVFTKAYVERVNR